MLDNLLQMAKIESKEFQIDRDETKVQSLFDDIQDSHGMDAESQNITLECDIIGIEDEVFDLDIPKIKSILNNLVSNAIKFTPEDGRITVTAEKKKDSICFTVSDTGAGIEESKLGEVFSRSYTTSSPYSKKSGTGLGLWISKKFVEFHGGNITVKK